MTMLAGLGPAARLAGGDRVGPTYVPKTGNPAPPPCPRSLSPHRVHTADWVQEQVHPKWQRQAVAAEGHVLQLRGELQDAKEVAQAPETERDEHRSGEGA